MFSVLFPGQGSQSVGMGKKLYEKFDYIRFLFQQADDILKKSISKIILEGPKEIIDQTENTQPAIFLISYSICEVIKKETSFNLNNAKFFAGHSLGEYTALVCAGSLTLEKAAYLLHERGKSMQEAVPTDQGAMIAILGMTIEEIEKEISLISKNDVCEIANDNCEGQVVVSGKKMAIETLNKSLKVKKKRGIILPVSAPFHCSLMKKASEKMEEKIKKTDFLKPNPYIISNVTANVESDVNKIKSLLVDQIVSRVRWRESVNYMIKQGVDDFIEIGPGKVLSGLVKKTSKDVKVSNFNSLEGLK